MLFLRNAGLVIAAMLLLMRPAFAQFENFPDFFEPFPPESEHAEQAVEQRAGQGPIVPPVISPAQAAKPTASSLLERLEASSQAVQNVRQAIGDPAPAAPPPHATAIRIIPEEPTRATSHCECIS